MAVYFEVLNKSVNMLPG